jgi:hypothetical protein
VLKVWTDNDRMDIVLRAVSRIACGFSKRLGDRSGRLIFFTRLNTLIVSRTAAIVAHEV